MSALSIILYTIGSLSAVLTLFQLTPYRHWIFRMPEYLCRQLLVTLSIILLVSLYMNSGGVYSTLFHIALVLAAIYLSSKVYPYTRFGEKDVPDAIPQNNYSQLRVLVINVLQENNQISNVCEIIRASDADIVLLIETDNRWSRGIHKIRQDYKEEINVCRDDTYGMILFSKHDIIKDEVRQTYDETPSLRCCILHHGERILVYGLHPKPPSPTEASTSIPKDAELRFVANEIKSHYKNDKLLVLGDINDVAWSKTTTAFRKTSGLHDPRRGRGSITTFPTYLPLMGFPLDQVFCSKEFHLIDIKRLPDIGSDHFPLQATLGYKKRANPK